MLRKTYSFNKTVKMVKHKYKWYMQSYNSISLQIYKLKPYVTVNTSICTMWVNNIYILQPTVY